MISRFSNSLLIFFFFLQLPQPFRLCRSSGSGCGFLL
jgi:hypothetical protein